MKKNILVVLFLSISTLLTAQQLYLEGGKMTTTFDYKDAQGKQLENFQATNNTFMAIGYKSPLFSKNSTGSVGLNYAGYGAIGSDDTVGNFMEWQLHYLAVAIGLDMTLFSIKDTDFYIKGTNTVGFLMQGTQTLNSKVMDLNNNDDFDTFLVEFSAGIGLTHPVSENLSFYVQYLYGKSLDIGSGASEFKIASNKVGFGLLIDISNY